MKLKILIPLILVLIILGSIIGGAVMYRYEKPTRKELRQVKKEAAERDKQYLKHVDSLNQVVSILEKEYGEIDTDIIHINKLRDEDLDSLSNLSFDEQLRHLSDRFNIGTKDNNTDN